MCYSNPLLHRGFEASVAALAAAGVAGLIVPDMPASEAGELRALCDAAGVALVPLVAPTTPPDRCARSPPLARGFIYVVSVTGVTGERGQLPPELAEVVGRVRSATELPVAVGFGIGTPEQAAAVGEMADGVIIGSRLVRTVRRGSRHRDRAWARCAVSWARCPPPCPCARLPRHVGLPGSDARRMCPDRRMGDRISPDVGAVVGLAILGIGILVQMAESAGASADADR